MTDSDVNHGESESSISTSLLHRIQQRDNVAWSRFVSLFRPLILLWCGRNNLQPNDSADIAQEVFAAVAGRVNQFHRNEPGSSFRAWLRRITTNKINDHFRKTKNSTRAIGGEHGNAIIENHAEAEANQAMLAEEKRLLYHQAVEIIRSEFNETHWKSFWRVVVDQQKADDVAEELKISSNVVYLAKSRILKRVREEFSQLLDDMDE